jgi:magnesium-transporting ATPase (P-type)
MLPILTQATFEYRKQLCLTRILKRLWGTEGQGTSSVLRDGQLISIPSVDIVVGDICQVFRVLSTINITTITNNSNSIQL